MSIRSLAALGLTLALAAPAQAGIPATAPERAGTTATCTGKTGKAGSFELTLGSGGQMRTYRLHVPAQYNPSSPMPLMLSFHGLGSNARQMEEGTKIIPKSDQAGFIVAHPDGFENSWNAGWCCAPASTREIDDVQFARDLVAAISEQYCVDADRVYAMGFSNGAFMTHRLACEAGDLFAAYAPHSGEIAVNECKPSRALPIVQVHGHSDVIVPWRFGNASMKKWAELNGCASSPTTVYEKGPASCVVYGGCTGGVAVEFCTVKQFGHDWAKYENTRNSIDSTDVYWDFLKQYTLP